MRPGKGDLSYGAGWKGRVGEWYREGELWAQGGEGAAGAGAGDGGGEGAATTYGGDRAAQCAPRPYLGGLADGAAGIAIFVQLDDIDVLSSRAEGFGVAGDSVAAIGGLNEIDALFTIWSADGFGPLEVSIGIQLDDIDVGFSCAEGGGLAGDGVAAIGGLNEGIALITLWSADSFGPLEVTISIQLDDIDIQESRAERGGGAGDGVAAIGGLNEGAAHVTRWSADGFGPLEVSIGIQLDDIDIPVSCAKGFGEAGDNVAPIGGLNEGEALVILWSADGFGPLEVTLGIQLDDIEIPFSCAEGFGVAGDGVAAIGGLNEGEAQVILWSADGFGPLEVTIGIQFDDIDIGFSCAEGDGDAGDGVAAIGGLNEGGALLTVWSADGFGPLEVPLGIQLDDIDISFSCAEGFGEAGDGIAAIGGLNEGVAPIILWSANSLTEVGRGADGRDDGISGRGGSDVRTLRWQRSGDKKR